MAAVKGLLVHNLSSRLSKSFLSKYFVNGNFNKRGRWFSMLLFNRLALHGQLTDQFKSYSALLRVFNDNTTLETSKHHSKVLKTRWSYSTVPDDPEFVSERVVIPDENIKDLTSFSEMIQKVKEKSDVIVKTLNEGDKEVKDNDTKAGWKVVVGGTRHEVKKASSYIKSLLNQERSKQRLIMEQDGEIDKQHSEKKEKPIWAYYRRNFKGQKPPMRTRKKCIRGTGESQVVSGNPCPICRLYLGGGYELDYKDIDLLSQFISPHTGEVFEATKTGVCRAQQANLIKAIHTAKDFGLLPYSIPGPRSAIKQSEHATIPRNVRLK